MQRDYSLTDTNEFAQHSENIASIWQTKTNCKRRRRGLKFQFQTTSLQFVVAVRLPNTLESYIEQYFYTSNKKKLMQAAYLRTFTSTVSTKIAILFQTKNRTPFVTAWSNCSLVNAAKCMQWSTLTEGLKAVKWLTNFGRYSIETDIDVKENHIKGSDHNSNNERQDSIHIFWEPNDMFFWK